MYHVHQLCQYHHSIQQVCGNILYHHQHHPMQNTYHTNLEDIDIYAIGILADSATDSAIIDINVVCIDIDITLIFVRTHHMEQVMMPLSLGQSTRFDSLTFLITSQLS